MLDGVDQVPALMGRLISDGRLNVAKALAKLLGKPEPTAPSEPGGENAKANLPSLRAAALYCGWILRHAQPAAQRSLHSLPLPQHTGLQGQGRSLVATTTSSGWLLQTHQMHVWSAARYETPNGRLVWHPKPWLRSFSGVSEQQSCAGCRWPLTLIAHDVAAL